MRPLMPEAVCSAAAPCSGGTPSIWQMPSAASALYTVKRPGMGTVTGMRRPSRRASKATLRAVKRRFSPRRRLLSPVP